MQNTQYRLQKYKKKCTYAIPPLFFRIFSPIIAPPRPSSPLLASLPLPPLPPSLSRLPHLGRGLVVSVTDRARERACRRVLIDRAPLRPAARAIGKLSRVIVA